MYIYTCIYIHVYIYIHPKISTAGGTFSLLRDVGSKRGSFTTIDLELTDLSVLSTDLITNVEPDLDLIQLNPLSTNIKQKDPSPMAKQLESQR